MNVIEKINVKIGDKVNQGDQILSLKIDEALKKTERSRSKKNLRLKSL